MNDTHRHTHTFMHTLKYVHTYSHTLIHVHCHAHTHTHTHPRTYSVPWTLLLHQYHNHDRLCLHLSPFGQLFHPSLSLACLESQSHYSKSPSDPMAEFFFHMRVKVWSGTKISSFTADSSLYINFRIFMHMIVTSLL